MSSKSLLLSLGVLCFFVYLPWLISPDQQLIFRTSLSLPLQIVTFYISLNMLHNCLKFILKLSPLISLNCRTWMDQSDPIWYWFYKWGPACGTIKPTVKSLKLKTVVGLPGSSDSKESARNVEDPHSTPGSGRCPGEENGNPLQYSCLENSMDKGAWRATVHGDQKESDTTERLTLSLYDSCSFSPCFLFLWSWNFSHILRDVYNFYHNTWLQRLCLTHY